MDTNVDLQRVIDALRGRHEHLPHAVAGWGADMYTPVALAGEIDTLEAWLEVQGIADDGMDQRTKAAYMIGGIAWSVCMWLALFEVTGQPPLRGVAIRQERYWWHGGGSSHEYVRYPLGVETGPGPGHRTTLEELFAPLIAATMVTSGLSAGAQWRILADNVARAFLDVGKAMGMVQHAMTIASDILAEGRLANGRTGFVEVTEGKASDWFVTRGGCCRYYTIAGGDYCAGCVLRKPEEQMASWRSHLASQRLE